MNSFPKTGAAVITDFGPYDHYSIVSDRLGQDGKPMLISHTQRNGTVKEEEKWTPDLRQ